MKRMIGLTLVCGAALCAGADDSANAIMNDWRTGSTNDYRVVMERRLNANDGDIGGLLMKYFWDRVFTFGAAGGKAQLTNTIDRLVTAARAYRGPRFSLSRDFYVALIDEDRQWQATHDFSSGENQAYWTTIGEWKCYGYMKMFAPLFRDLEADGAFRDPPTVWTDDPSLYRVVESDTNCLVCVTNLWNCAGLTNVANIAARRLSRNSEDLAARLLAMDCALQYGDNVAATNHLAFLERGIASVTNAAVNAVRTDFKDDARQIRGTVERSGSLPPLVMPFRLPPDTTFPHVELLNALLESHE